MKIMRISLILIFLVVTTNANAIEEKMCWVTFDYGGRPTNGPGGQGGSLATTEDPFVYKICKKNCYDFLPTKYKNIQGFKSCTIDGVPIEESKYKKIYLKNKANICHVQVVGKYTFYVDLASSVEDCKFIKNEFIWCKQGAECTYTFGQW